jgi:hypothetical protein
MSFEGLVGHLFGAKKPAETPKAEKTKDLLPLLDALRLEATVLEAAAETAAKNKKLFVGVFERTTKFLMDARLKK